jgi:hypothetical protein
MIMTEYKSFRIENHLNLNWMHFLRQILIIYSILVCYDFCVYVLLFHEIRQYHSIF